MIITPKLPSSSSMVQRDTSQYLFIKRFILMNDVFKAVRLYFFQAGGSHVWPAFGMIREPLHAEGRICSIPRLEKKTIDIRCYQFRQGDGIGSQYWAGASHGLQGGDAEQLGFAGHGEDVDTIQD